jgi:hypothetical protein
MYRFGWLLVVTQLALATYSLRVICRQIGRDRRCPSRDRIMAIRAAYWTAIAILVYGSVMALTADKRYSFVTEWIYMGCMASSFVSALAIRILRGDGGIDDRR